MSVVEFPDGTEYDDDGSTAGTMLRGGHRQNLIPMLSRTVAMASQVVADRSASAGSASAAAVSAGQASGSATTAGLKALAAAEEVIRAKAEADRAKAEADRAETAAGSVDPTEISDIAGLQAALDAKQLASATPAAVRATPLTGLSLATATAIVATDTVLTATGKLQGQVTSLKSVVISPSCRTITANGSVATTEMGVLLLLNGASPFTLALPAVASVPAGFSFNVRNIAAVGVGTVTIDPNGAELIAGRATIPVYGGEEGFTIQSTGTAWQCIGRAKEVVISLITISVATAQIDIEAPFIDPEMRAVQIDVRMASAATSGEALQAIFKIGASYTSYSGYYWGGVVGGSGGYNLSAATFNPSNGSASKSYVTGRMFLSCGAGVPPSLQFVGARYDFSFVGFGVSAAWSVRNGALTPTGVRIAAAAGNIDTGDFQVVGIRA